VYSDNSGEIGSACAKLGWLHDTLVPGIPQTNALIERTNQSLVSLTITCLVEAGLPPCFWSFAAPCAAFLRNVRKVNGVCPYNKAHGTEFAGNHIPFGARVSYKPSPTKKTDTHLKWAAPSRVGVFAGYKLHSGYRWKGEYLVWDLDEFLHRRFAQIGPTIFLFSCAHLTSRKDVICMISKYSFRSNRSTNGSMQPLRVGARAP
jgi:hypothetical protein